MLAAVRHPIPLVGVILVVGAAAGFIVTRVLLDWADHPPPLATAAVPGRRDESPAAPGDGNGGDTLATVAALRQENAALSAEVRANRHRQAIEDRLDLRIVGSASHFSQFTSFGHFTGDPVDRDKFTALLPTVLDELDRYPDRAIRRMGLRRVIVCSRLREFGQSEGGVAVGPAGTIYLEAEWFDEGATALRHVVNHELFHLIDYATTTPWDDDTEWRAGNPAGFSYGSPGVAGTSGTSAGSSGGPGFVSAYARTNIREDRAEVFGWMMSDPLTVTRLARGDPGLARKVDRMEAIVARFDPDLGNLLTAIDLDH